jgi:hypothetical protein
MLFSKIESILKGKAKYNFGPAYFAMIISQNSIPLSLLYKVNCDILEIKILYKLGENLSKNEFARAFTSNNSQN